MLFISISAGPWNAARVLAPAPPLCIRGPFLPRQRSMLDSRGSHTAALSALGNPCPRVHQTVHFKLKPNGTASNGDSGVNTSEANPYIDTPKSCRARLDCPQLEHRGPILMTTHALLWSMLNARQWPSRADIEWKPLLSERQAAVDAK